MILCVIISTIFILSSLFIFYMIWKRNKEIIDNLKNIKEIKQQQQKRLFLLAYSYIYEIENKKIEKYETFKKI